MFRFCALSLAAALLAGWTVNAFGLMRPAAPPPPAPLSALVMGKVTLDGHAVPHGVALVVADDGRVFHSPIQKGRFFLRAPIGGVRLAIHGPPMMPIHGVSEPMVLRIPRTAGDPRLSGLRSTLIDGGQEMAVELESAR